MQLLKDLRAHILHHRADEDTPYLAAGAVLSLMLVATFVVFGSQVAERIAYTYGNVAAVISAALVDMANADRGANGARSLTVSPVLTAAAQAKANDMAAKGYFSHFDAQGKGPWDWMREEGYQYRYAGENLAIQFSESGDVERAWLNSPAHRQNLLDDRFTEVGIAVAQGMYEGQPTTFVVQFFGTPAPVMAVRDPAPAPTPEVQAATGASAPVPALEPIAVESESGVVVLGLAQDASRKAPEPAEPEPATHISLAASSTSGTLSVLFTQTQTPTPLGEPVVARQAPEPFVASPWTYLTPILRILGMLAAFALAYLMYIETMEAHRRHAISAGALAIACTVIVISLPAVTHIAKLDSGVTAFAADPSAHFSIKQTHDGVAYASDVPHSTRVKGEQNVATANVGAAELIERFIDGAAYLLSH